jgi:hypothetical protein
MSVAGTSWPNFNHPFNVFGPLLTIDSIINVKESQYFNKYSRAQQTVIFDVAQHVVNFLGRPHPGLGRIGNVCPYIPDSVHKNLCRITATHESGREKIESAVVLMKDVFLHMQPSSIKIDLLDPGDCLLKAIVVVFTAVSKDKAEELIGGIQKQLKPHFIPAGLMIGQFYPNCPEPGLNNPDFRPLQMPAAALAIRHITKFDAPFMLGSDTYVNAFVNIFGDDGARRIDQLRQKNLANRSASRAMSKKNVQG